MAKAGKIADLVAALDARFQSVANIVKSTAGWSETLSDNKYPSEKLVKNSLDNKENASNKVTSLSGTVTDDQYPSALTVQTALNGKESSSNKVTSLSGTVTDDQYPSALVVQTALSSKLESADLPDSTSDLTNDGEDGTHPFITAEDLDVTEVTVEKQASAETGYAHTYVIKQNGTQVGSKINIPKDYLVKSGELKVAAAADLTTLGSGFAAGDKYLDFVINTKGNDGTDEHIYINVKDLVEDTTYSADNTTLELDSATGVFSIKASGVDTTEIKDNAVTTTKINNKAVTTAKIDDGAITATQIATSLSETWLDTGDVDDEIEDYIDALTIALTPSS